MDKANSWGPSLHIGERLLLVYWQLRFNKWEGTEGQDYKHDLRWEDKEGRSGFEIVDLYVSMSKKRADETCFEFFLEKEQKSKSKPYFDVWRWRSSVEEESTSFELGPYLGRSKKVVWALEIKIFYLSKNIK